MGPMAGTKTRECAGAGTMQGLRHSCRRRLAEPAPNVSANSKRRRLGHRVLFVFLLVLLCRHCHHCHHCATLLSPLTTVDTVPLSPLSPRQTPLSDTILISHESARKWTRCCQPSCNAAPHRPPLLYDFERALQFESKPRDEERVILAHPVCCSKPPLRCSPRCLSIENARPPAAIDQKIVDRRRLLPCALFPKRHVSPCSLLPALRLEEGGLRDQLVVLAQLPEHNAHLVLLRV